MKAIVCLSAGTSKMAAATVSTRPKTVHDFGGFPRELYEVHDPSPGDPELAQRMPRLLAPLPVRLDEQSGLDHGAWAVLCDVYPKADIPIARLSNLDACASGRHAQEPYHWTISFEKRLRDRLLARERPTTPWLTLKASLVARLAATTPDHAAAVCDRDANSIRVRRLPRGGRRRGSISMFGVQVG